MELFGLMILAFAQFGFGYWRGYRLAMDYKPCRCAHCKAHREEEKNPLKSSCAGRKKTVILRCIDRDVIRTPYRDGNIRKAMVELIREYSDRIENGVIEISPCISFEIETQNLDWRMNLIACYPKEEEKKCTCGTCGAKLDDKCAHDSRVGYRPAQPHTIPDVPAPPPPPGPPVTNVINWPPSTTPGVVTKDKEEGK